MGSALTLGLTRTDAAHVGLGAFVLVMALAASTRLGDVLTFTLLVALVVFALVVVGFVAAPHVALASVIPLFALLPAVKALYLPWVGPLKDVVTVAAVTAAGAAVVQAARGGRRIPGDVWIVALCAFLLALYALNIGGGLERTWGWAHGLRLFALPLALLLVGLTLGHPRRTLRYALISLIATATAVASVGILQQIVGASRLVELGWAWDLNVRTIDGFLRSFGTLDEPFAYAAFLVFGLGAIVMWAPRRPLTFVAGAVIVVGLSFSVVRSAGLIAVGLLALLLARHGRTVTAVFLLAVVAVAAVTFVFSQEATERRVVQGGPSLFFTLNGRTEAWKVVFEQPADMPLGRGVGEVGTAANRATFTVTRTRQEATRGSKALVVDSGYFATVADIGLVGLAALLLLLSRLALLGHRAVARGRPEGWIALAFVLSLALDAVTRESFTAFPTAYVGLLVTGLALAAAQEEPEAPEAPRAARGRATRPRARPGLPHPGTTGA